MMSGNQKQSPRFWTSLVRQFRLAWRLLWDPRVPGWTKLVPFLAFLYIISPVDFLPDWFFGVGQLDDLGVLLVGVRLFTALVPEDIVLQHLEAMGLPVSQWRVVEDETRTIEGEFEVRED
jgi:uncharacterized membrane protein YkvA (DUF1232 family)